MKFLRIFTVVFAVLLTVNWLPEVAARSSFFSAPPDGSQACSDCHGSNASCAGCHAHGVHPDRDKNSINVTATTDKATYTVGETVIVSITGSYRSGWVRTKLWDKDCSAVGCLTDGAVVINSNDCPSCPVGVGGDDGATNEFPGPVTMSFPAPAMPGIVTWSASWYGNDFDLSQIGGSTTFGPLWLPDPNNDPHGDEIVTFTFEVVAGANNPPVAVDDLVAAPVNTSINIDVLINDTDADTGDTVTVNSFDSVSVAGAVVSCNPSLTSPTPQCIFTPVTNLCSTDSFTYDATDGTDVSNRATVSIQVGDANAPIITAPADLTITLPAGSSGPVPATDAGIAAWLASATASDPEEGGITVSNNAPTEFPVGTIPVTFAATDSCGNAAISVTANVTVEVAPNNTPVVTAPAPISVTAGLCATSVPATESTITTFLSSATATDVEDGPLAVSNNAPANFLLGDTLVTFTASDSLSATGSAGSTVTVNETPNTAPVLTTPTPLTLSVPAGTTSVSASDPAIAAFLASASANDAEDGVLIVTHDAPANFPLGTTTVTFTTTDACGLVTTSTATVTITEAANTTPTVTAPAPISITAGLCATSVPATNSAITSFLNSATATDVEDGPLAVSNNAPADFLIGSTLVTFTATDSLSATGSDSATVTVNAAANSAPTVTAPTPITIVVDAGVSSVPVTDPAIVAFLAAASATDTEDGVLSVSNDAPANFLLGTTTVTFTATDACGLVTTATSTVTINGGNAAPVLSLPAPITVTAGLCSISVPATDSAITTFLNSATATDVEDGVLTVSNDAPADFLIGSTVVTFSVTDSGDPTGTPLTTTGTSTVTIDDPNLAPVLTAPAPITITVLAGTTSVPVSDAAIVAFLAAASANDENDGVLTVSNDAPASFPLGVTTVTFTATDSCGVVATSTATVTINEAANTAPSVTAPAPLSVTAGLCVTSLPATDSAIATFLNSATATDVEDGALAVSNDAPADFLIGSTLVTFTATDSLLATGSSGSTVTINETPNSAPVITAPAPLIMTVLAGTTSVPVSDPTITAFLAEASASDTEDGVLSVSNDAPANFPLGTTTVTFTTTDACGLVTTSTVTVTINEAANTTPTVTAPSPINVTAGLCATSVPATNAVITAFLNSATATDVEDGSLAVSNNAPANFLLGDTLVTFTATDSLSATGSAGATVTVNETPNSLPAVTAPMPITIIVAQGTTSVAASDPTIAAFLAGASATDTEDGVLIVSHDAPANFPLGTTTVTFTATDACGLVTTATATVTIQEIAGNTAPVLTPPAPITATAGLCATSVSALNPAIESFLSSATATDAEDGNLRWYITTNAPRDFFLGNTLVTFTVTDSGDPSGIPITTTGTSTVSVNAAPNAAPDVTAPAPLTLTVAIGTISVPANNPAIAAFLAAASGSDPEDGSVLISHDAPANFPLGTTTVTFTATDACGLVATATATVTIVEGVVPNTAPTLTAPAPISVAAGLCASSISASDPAIAAFLSSATANDAEDGPLPVSNDAPLNFLLGDTLVTFTVTDSGAPTATPLTTTATSTVAVFNPNTAPSVTAPAPLTLIAAIGTTSVSASDPAIAGFLAAASASDAEDGVLIVSNDAPASFPLGTTTVTFTATDACGLVATATATVIIEEEPVPNTAPTLTPPAPITVTAGLCASSVPALNPAVESFLSSATATDAEDGNLRWYITTNAPRDFQLGNTLVTFTVTDSGNPSGTRITTIGTSTVSVNAAPNTAPTLTAPAPITVTVTFGTPSLAASDPAIAAFLAAASASDPEDGNVLISHDAPASFPLGTTTVTFTATDACGLIATATATVTIQEGVVPNTAPTLIAPVPISVAAGLCASSISASDPTIAAFLNSATANDAEDGPLPVSNDAPLNFLLGDTLVTFTVTDSGNPTATPLTTTATSSVTAFDPNTVPTLSAPAPLTLVVAIGTTSVAASDPTIAAFLAAASASDNEDGNLLVSNDAPANFPLGTTTVTFTATDACGLVATATATVTIEEEPVPNTAPTLIPPAPITVTAGAGETSVSALHPAIDTFLSSATATDAEDGNLRWYITTNAPRDFFLGTTVVTFTVTDSGNPSGIRITTTATSTVTVNAPLP